MMLLLSVVTNLTTMDLSKEGKPERDSLGRIKYRHVTDEESEASTKLPER